MRRILFVVAVVIGFGLGALVKHANAAPAPGSSGGSPGRWQVVNGTPDMTRNIMLLDSTTGETWVTCSSEDGRSWCYMPRTNHRTTGASAADGLQ